MQRSLQRRRDSDRIVFMRSNRRRGNSVASRGTGQGARQAREGRSPGEADARVASRGIGQVGTEERCSSALVTRGWMNFVHARHCVIAATGGCTGAEIC